MTVDTAAGGREALAKARERPYDAIILDLSMPEMDGIEATRRIIAGWPEARILVLTSFASDDKVFPAIKAGALGFSTSRTILHKSVDGELVPGTTATKEELIGIGRAMGRVGYGVFEMASDLNREWKEF